jgi:hypothetical protein
MAGMDGRDLERFDTGRTPVRPSLQWVPFPDALAAGHIVSGSIMLHALKPQESARVL